MKANNIWILSLLLCLYGCGGGSDDPVAPTPEPPPTPEVVEPEIKLPSEITTSGIAFTENKAAEKSVSFTCNDDWTLSMTENRSVSWCTPSATSGKKGNVTITFKVTENTTYDDRSVTITIKCGSASTSFSISQEGIKAMKLTQKRYELTQEGGNITIEVNANVDYQVIINKDAQDWISEQKSKGLATAKHTLVIQPNEQADSRKGEIYFKSNIQTDTVTVQQAFKPTLALVKKEYSVSESGETITVDIQSNVEYEVQMPEVQWVKQAEKARTLKDSQANFVISPNESTEGRNAKIIFINKSASVSDTLAVSQKGAPETSIGTGNNITDWNNNGNSNSGSASEQ